MRLRFAPGSGAGWPSFPGRANDQHQHACLVDFLGEEDGGEGEQATLAGQQRERDHGDGGGRDQRADPAHELQ